MSELTFPYKMYCPSCKSPLKVTSPKMIGKFLNCPKCDKRIEIVTPDEDGNIPYSTSYEPPFPPDPGLRDKDQDELDQKEKAERQFRTSRQMVYMLELTLVIFSLTAIIFLWWWVVYGRLPKETEEKVKIGKVPALVIKSTTEYS